MNKKMSGVFQVALTKPKLHLNGAQINLTDSLKLALGPMRATPETAKKK